MREFELRTFKIKQYPTKCQPLIPKEIRETYSFLCWDLCENEIESICNYIQFDCTQTNKLIKREWISKLFYLLIYLSIFFLFNFSIGFDWKKKAHLALKLGTQKNVIYEIPPKYDMFTNTTNNIMLILQLLSQRWTQLQLFTWRLDHAHILLSINSDIRGLVIIRHRWIVSLPLLLMIQTANKRRWFIVLVAWGIPIVRRIAIKDIDRLRVLILPTAIILIISIITIVLISCDLIPQLLRVRLLLLLLFRPCVLSVLLLTVLIGRIYNIISLIIRILLPRVRRLLLLLLLILLRLIRLILSCWSIAIILKLLLLLLPLRQRLLVL